MSNDDIKQKKRNRNAWFGRIGITKQPGSGLSQHNGGKVHVVIKNDSLKQVIPGVFLDQMDKIGKL